MHSTHQRHGAMLLITVMILGTIALLIGIGLALRGIGEMDMSYSSSQAQKAQAIADGCAEEALGRLWADSSYTGGDVTIGQGVCTISVLDTDNERSVHIEATIDVWKHSVQLHVNAETLQMQLHEWQRTY